MSFHVRAVTVGFLILVSVGGVATLTVSSHAKNKTEAALPVKMCQTPAPQQVWIESGGFTMGDNKTYSDEGPEHSVQLDGFWIDAHEVTNRQFAQFVSETGYITVAERRPDPALLEGAPPEMFKPGSAVFMPPKDLNDYTRWWSYVPGANWRSPEGPKSSIDGKEDYPVVHMAFEDAQTYAKWAGRALATEAQYEFAARSKRKEERYAWGGKDIAPEGLHKANTWQGFFPVQNSKEDGFSGLAPIACYEPNDYGAYDMIGNVWEWTGNWYADAHNANDEINPIGPKENQSKSAFPERVLKGGSFLCAPNFCMRYRPAARHAQDVGLGASHIGFRTVLNSKAEILTE